MFNLSQLRAAKELEDLRVEKESLHLMKQQLAAVHQLRVDLQRKESVIQVSVTTDCKAFKIKHIERFEEKWWTRGA